MICCPYLCLSQDELKCGCLDKRSPSSLRVKNSRLFPAAAKLQGTVNNDLGVFSAHLMDVRQKQSILTFWRDLNKKIDTTLMSV